MSSRIIFLGTAAEGVVTDKQKRASGGIIFEVDGWQFHLDPGPGALVRARQYNINLRQNIAVLATSDSLAHCNDINTVIDAMTHAGLDRRGVLVGHKNVVENILLDSHKNKVERVIIAEAGKRIGIEHVDIIVLKTKDTEKAVGFKFFTPDFVCTYSSDTGYTPDLIHQYKDSDILILNVPLPSGKESNTQLNREDAIKIIKEVKPKLAIITHFSTKMLEADPLYEARVIQQTTNTQVLAAKDGLVLVPSNYSAYARQKNLLNMNRFNNQPDSILVEEDSDLY